MDPTPAKAVDRYIRAQRIRTTQAYVAKFLGLSRSAWNRYLTTDRSPTAATISGWLAKLDADLAANGADRFRAQLQWRSDGCEVREVLVD